MKDCFGREIIPKIEGPMTLEEFKKLAAEKLMCERGHPSGAICMCFMECQHCIDTRHARRVLHELQKEGSA